MMPQKMSIGQQQDNPFRAWWSTRSFLQKRTIRFGISMIVLALCVSLYEAGFFGTVDGPLHPARIGDSLSGMGVTKTHSAVFFLTLLIVAAAWNWVFNIASYLAGARLTCTRTDGEGKACGARVERRKAVRKKRGGLMPLYVCTAGHKRPDAHFHPVRKGTMSHTLWAVALAFCIVVFFLS
jgi:hypothetical protein